ncbi:arylamine N-acetyltransferase family protein [Marinobacterium arenosum]|uniref:arylamine N-acetyltransferase family protein n=1 Tax=Marinobacterium arenosum TaxID=2862496 RepID=UPI001C967014|nr:arylamine N-acetyltransferase [Marinobacterium arenosum]MBY4678851.1 arylamine N-acetyltransferase [Marinobacterium arenosum]
MNISTNTQAYLQDLALSVGWPDIEFLNQLQSRHLERYSFNSLAVVLGQEVPIDSDSVFDKIVRRGRGGYCFEHNKLTFDALTDLGFEVRILLARVVYGQDRDAPRSHRITLLTLNGQQYIVDTGFGHYGARYPVALQPGLVQEQGDATYRIEALSDGSFGYQILKDGAFFTLYRFDLGDYSEADCLTGHFFSHRYPTAGFVNNLVVCTKNADEIRSLRNDALHLIRHGETEVRPIDSAVMLCELLNQEFHLETDQAVADYLYDRFVLPNAA